jgi:hypothetical protein
MSREIHYCKCGQSIFHDMTDCGDCEQSVGMVIGVDPGPEHSAFVCLSNGRVFDRGIVTNEELAKCDGYWSSRQVFIEMIACYGMAVGASVFETCVWIGRFTELSRLAGGKLSRVFRRDIKLHLCNSPRAKDGNVRQALIDRLGPQGTKKAPGPTYGVKSHEWAALAVAVYGWDMTFGRASGPSKTNSNPPGAPDR